MKQARAAFEAQQKLLAAKRLVFVDESGLHLGTPPRFGWALKGEKSLGSAIRGQWRNMTMIGAIALSGFRGFLTIDAPTTGEIFLAFVVHQLCPNLRRGDLVVMDNLGSHKVKGVQEAIEAAGAEVLYLPPYSPDFNPIEKTWAKLKDRIRQLANDTRELFDAAVAAAMDTISDDDIRGWFQHAGYRLTST